MNFFPLNVLNVSSNRLPEERQSHIVCICVTFIHCVFANVPSDRLLERMHFPSVYFQMSPQIACMWESLVALLAFVWFVSSVRFQMSPKIAYMRWCKVTLVAFVWFFSTVCFQMCCQMCLQIVCLRGCKSTLVAFVRLFSTVLSNVFLNCLPVDLHFMTFDILWHFAFHNILHFMTFYDIWHFITFCISWHLAFHDIWHFMTFGIS